MTISIHSSAVIDDGAFGVAAAQLLGDAAGHDVGRAPRRRDAENMQGLDQ